MFGLGFTEILVILAVVLLVVGPEKLPELSRAMGRTMWQLRRAAEDFRSELSLTSLESERNLLRDELRDLRNLSAEEPGAGASPRTEKTAVRHEAPGPAAGPEEGNDDVSQAVRENSAEGEEREP